jgi:hypothetical protein
MKLPTKLFSMALGFSGLWTLCFILSDKVSGVSSIMVFAVVMFLIALGAAFATNENRDS